MTDDTPTPTAEPPAGKERATFIWASIAGASPEPVEIIERDGRRGVLTIGCPDPFWLDDTAANVRLHDRPMGRPDDVTTEVEREAYARLYALQYPSHAHSWRGSR